MADLRAGHWALISDGNPDNLRTFFQGFREQGVETAGIVIAPPSARKRIDAEKLDWPPGWSLYKAGPLWSKHDQWFGLLWDDQCPECPKWDVTLVEKLPPWGIATSCETINGDWRKGAVAWGMQGLMIGGGLDLSDLSQSLSNWELIGKESKAWAVENLVQMSRRVGPQKDLPPPNVATAAITRFKSLMDQYGVRSIEPDWTGVSIMLSTPSMASRPEALWMISLFATLEEFRRLGVKCQWSLERYNADIGLARSHILSEFMRSDFSHLLMIDDDMTWEIPAIHRMVYANEPFVAVAGPKKRYPLKFAASHVDDNNDPLPLVTDPDKAIAEVTSVGAAFTLIRRDCVEKMIAAYPELEYVGGDGKIGYGLFLPAIENRRWLPEDFAFCQRWRKIGGKVYICPDVPLGHIGAHEFKGDLMSNAIKQAAPL